MPRPNKIWFRSDVQCWMVTIAGKKIRLAKGKENKSLAEQKFHELMLVQHQAPESSDARVADLVESFLAFAHKRMADDTYRNYRFYAQKFAEACGKLAVSELKPFHVTRWIDTRNWNETTERNGRRVAHRVFSWAKEEGLIHANPLDGMKSPAAKTRTRALTSAEFRCILGAAHGPLRILIWSGECKGDAAQFRVEIFRIELRPLRPLFHGF